jgi:hypothetical protein
MFLLSSDEDRSGLTRFPVAARVFPYPLSSATLASRAGSLFGQNLHEQEADVRWSTVFSSPAPHLIVLLVVTPPPLRRVRSQHLCLCALAARSKAAGEHLSRSTHRASPVLTADARTLGSPILTSMHVSEVAHMTRSSVSKPFEVLLATLRSLLDATPRCFV